MKRQTVITLAAGDTVEDLFALTEKNLAQKRNGDPYLTVTLTDKTGRIKGVVWDDAQRIAAETGTGEVVAVSGTVSAYRDALQLTIRDMRKVPQDSVDPSDFLPVSGRDMDRMFERLKGMTERMQAPHWRALFKAFWEDEALVKGFCAAPAAKKMHHAYVGGLLEHTLSMALLAQKIASHYKGIDQELLLAGVILHDIGKIRELTAQVTIDYSDEGRLVSHIVLGLEILAEKLQRVKDFPVNQALLLKHLIISHHGSRAFGSPEPPKTVEAVLLNYIDEIDAKVQGIREFIAREPADGGSWTSFHRLLERHFYKGT